MLTAESCLICSSDHLGHHTITASTREERVAAVCQACNFVALSDSQSAVVESERTAGIVGGVKTPGRMFWNVVNAVEMLGRDALSVAVWEPPAPRDSSDIGRISQIPAVTEVNTFWPTPETESTAPVPPPNSDIVVGTEILQYLPDPRADLASLFRSVSDDGLAILTTDLYDGAPIESLGFPRGIGRRWQWSQSAISEIASATDGHVDFRLLQIGVDFKFRRKRAIFYSRNTFVLANVREWFGDNLAALSERKFN